MSLSQVWLQLRDGDLVRGDQISEISVHPAPQLAGKPARWLVDVVVPTTSGAGDTAVWRWGPVHRTMAECDVEPSAARVALAGLLARLDGLDAAGIVRSHVRLGSPGPSRPDHSRPERAADQPVRFAFCPFDGADRVETSETRPSSVSALGASCADPLAGALDSAFAFLANGDGRPQHAG